MSEIRTPRAFRVYKMQFVAIAPLLVDDAYLEMSERSFVGAAMKNSGGSLNPAEVALIFQRLMAEAGLSPIT